MHIMTNSRKKVIIFYAGVLLMFMTSMNKVLVPNAMFDELKNELGISGEKLAAMGAGFMYAYAISQLALGILSSKFGGVRILLFGASMFTLGSITFPFLSSANLMILTRALTGLGSGTVFIGLAKIIGDIFPKKFSQVLGIVLFFTYFGPVTGNLPMVALVRATSWRIAMAVPAVISLFVLITILIFLRGTLKPVLKGDTLSPLWILCKDKNSWLVFAASSVVFGSSYFISTIAGNKILTDIGRISPFAASLAVTIFAVVIAMNNIFGAIILKLLNNSRKALMMLAGIFHLTGTILCAISVYKNWGTFFIIAGFMSIAIPAGLFAVFSTVIKELHPQKYTGLAVAMLNFFAFVAIAGCGNIAGSVFARFEGGATYPPVAYAIIFGIFSCFALAGLTASFFLPETDNKQKN